MVTPLLAEEQLDVEGLESLVEHLIQGGVHGLFILGTTGEGLSLSHRVRRELVQRTCELVSNRTPVLVGVTDTSLQESIALAEFAGNAGANAVVLAPPIYFPHEQAELSSCARVLSERSPLPVMLYNIPALTKIPYEPATVEELSETPNIVGIKDSSGDLDYFQELRARTRSRKNWTLLTGHDLLLGQAVALGGDGGVCGGANVFPQLFVDLYTAACDGNHTRVAELQSSVVKLSELYRVRGNSTLGVIRGIKFALEELGICSGRMAAPSSSLPSACCAEVRAIVSDVKNSIAAACA